MIVECTLDRMGCLTLAPANKRTRRKAKLHLQRWGHEHSDGTAFIQSDDEVDSFIAEYVTSPRKRFDLRNGWTTCIRMDPWVFGNYIGYDFHRCI